MTPRGLKILLGASLAANVFLAGAVVGGAVIGARLLREQAPAAQNGRPASEAALRMHGPERERFHEAVRGAALSARPDFREAREQRRRAVELAGAPAFDRAAVQAALDASRAAEQRGRVKVEAGVVEVMAGLSRAERQAAAPMLARGPRAGARHGRRAERMPPPA